MILHVLHCRLVFLRVYRLTTSVEKKFHNAASPLDTFVSFQSINFHSLSSFVPVDATRLLLSALSFVLPHKLSRLLRSMSYVMIYRLSFVALILAVVLIFDGMRETVYKIYLITNTAKLLEF